jgi:hypothetical protein
MSYAAPFAYAAKAMTYDPYSPSASHPRPLKQRRRRIRMLLPSLRPRRGDATPALVAGSLR